MAPSPVFVVAACIVRGDEVLLARRHQPSLPEAHERWELPGGKVDFQENPGMTVVRELQEELNMDIRPVRLLPHLQSNIYHRLDGTTTHSVVAAYECVVAAGSPQPRPDESSVTRVKWVPITRLADYDLLPGTIDFINCLTRDVTATFGQSESVRLAKRDPDGLRRYVWEMTTTRQTDGSCELKVLWRDLRNHTRKETRRSGLSDRKAAQIMEARTRAMIRGGYEWAYHAGMGPAGVLQLRLGGL